MEIKLNSETLSGKKIFVGTPMYGGSCLGMYMKSCLDLQSVAAQYGVEVKFSFLFNESLIQRARNYIADEFLNRSDCTHLMFIDADIGFNPNDIIEMVKRDVDICCGLYPKKEINWQTVRNAVEKGVPNSELHAHTGVFVVNLVDYQEQARVRIDTPVEIWNGGTGFMLIKRHVLENMRQLVPSYVNDVLDLSGQITHDKIAELFPVFIDPDSGRLLSEPAAAIKT